MCDKELIVGYLYGELTRDEWRALEAHLASCAECRTEVEELRSTRQHLALWHPPEPDLGFRVIRGGSAPAPALPRRSPVASALRYAAAAVIVLAAGAAFANLEVRYGVDGVTVRTGWGRVAPTPPPTVVSSGSTDSPQARPASADFAALDRRLQEVESSLSRAATNGMTAAAAQTPVNSRMSDAEILRQVRRIVAEAEARQDTAVAARLLGVFRDLDARRRTDLAVMQHDLAQYQTLTNAEIAQNRDIANQLVRAAARQEK